MGLFKQVFAWWDSATLGTRFLTWRLGDAVGTDDDGNRYYRSKQATRGGHEKNTPTERGSRAERRWVIYNGEADASRVPPEWHAWLHFIIDEPPSVVPLPTKPWEREHAPNLTGTAYAYHPPGSLFNRGDRPLGTGEYHAWRPED